jgi:hypothetical protein
MTWHAISGRHLPGGVQRLLQLQLVVVVLYRYTMRLLLLVLRLQAELLHLVRPLGVRSVGPG